MCKHQVPVTTEHFHWLNHCLTSLSPVRGKTVQAKVLMFTEQLLCQALCQALSLFSLYFHNGAMRQGPLSFSTWSLRELTAKAPRS